VLVNLLGNAVKFTERGGVAVRVSSRDGEGLAPRLCVEVEDTGPGIDAAKVDDLFHPFAQTRVGIYARGGTGLGLALSREFARLLGGDVTVESRVRQGSTFRLDLPVGIGRPPPEDAPRPRGRVVGVIGTERRARVLLIDDDRDDRRWVCQLLEQVGFDVREAAPGADALTRLEEWRPVLVLVNPGEAGVDGYSAIRALRAQPAGRRAALVALTSSRYEDALDGITEAGADGVLSKPLREDAILEEIRNQLGVEYTYADPPPPERSSQVPNLLATRHERVRSLPAPLVESLRAAAHIADYDRFTELLARVPDQHADVAEALRELVEQYAYEQIETILVG